MTKESMEEDEKAKVEKSRKFIRLALEQRMEHKISIVDLLEVGPKLLAKELTRSIKNTYTRDKLRVNVTKLDLFEVWLELEHVETKSVLVLTWGGVQYAGRKAPVVVRNKQYTSKEAVAEEVHAWIKECREILKQRQAEDPA